MKLPRVMALDIATTTGVAVDAVIDPRPIIFSIECGRDDGYLGKAFATYERKIREAIKMYRPEVLAYEAPVEQKRGAEALNSLVTAQKLLGLVAITQLIGFKLDLRLMPCNIQEVRRHFTGSGWSDKAVVWERCKLLGWKCANMDESDSAAAWDFAKSKLKLQALTSTHRSTT